MRKIAQYFALSLICLLGNMYMTQAQKAVFGISPMGLSKQTTDIVPLLQEYLNKEMPFPVEVRMYDSVYDLVKALQGGEAQYAYINPFGYLLAKSEAALEVLAMRGNPDGQPEVYRSCLVVPQAVPLNSIEDLQDHMGEYPIIFTNVTSTSGHLLPRLVLNKAGIQAEVYFSDIVFAGTHQAVIERLHGGEPAVLACSYDLLQMKTQEGSIDPASYKILWNSEAIPHGPIVCQSSLDATQKETMLKALQTIPEKAPALWQIFTEKLWRNPKVRIIKGEESVFDYLQALVESDEELMFILDFYLAE
ncbi:MAG: putative selenate ABC transporter substrate-binding protein [Thermonema sp.]|uniref:phosphate/phosphite/phosphonate ABC transporter substrate-binding protein n=1 Tax=Thermonema sp. TaxID=2231181 RepID=UPI0021DD5329|nr:phosphate/phosphite/phosphonate ABC transporter substrate-binding protein [Thermonema sp.]GIV39850.1 MAG: putative selenate ABC transporter substrate-binding protein [Thermonema sp.]